MFAVPGWKLSTSRPVQEQSKPLRNKSKSQDSFEFQPSSKKRKQSDVETRPEVVRHGAEKANEGRKPIDTAKGFKKKKHKENGHSNRDHDLQKARGSSRGSNETSERSQSQEQDTTHSSTDTSTVDKRKQETKDIQLSATRSAPNEKKLNQTRAATDLDVPRTTSPHLLPPSSSVSLTPLQAKMRAKLTSARFRHINETLYTTSSDESLQFFTSSPELFAEYHTGFSQQVRDSWPQNPVDNYIQNLKRRGPLSNERDGMLPLPRRKTGSCTIADLGCGDAPLARGCQSVTKKLNLRFHSYDLHASNSLVTRADMANLPLRDGEADIAVFCLSLMGTNWLSFVEEAWRILRGDGKGEVWVAEVKSRFGRATKGRVVDNSVGKRKKQPKQQRSRDDGGGDDDDASQFIEEDLVGGQPADETDITAFVEVFHRRGFVLKENSVEKGNKMFVSMIFLKSGVPRAGKHKGMKWNGKEYQQMEAKEHHKARFVGGQKGIDRDNEPSPETEAKVLKPCVYKIR